MPEAVTQQATGSRSATVSLVATLPRSSERADATAELISLHADAVVVRIVALVPASEMANCVDIARIPQCGTAVAILSPGSFGT